MAEGRDDARIAEIRARHVLYDFGMVAPESGKWIASVSCRGCHRPWPCEPAELLERLDALEAERDGLAVDIVFQRRRVQSAYEASLNQAHISLEAQIERDALASRLAAAEAALQPCNLALEYRDGVTCREERDRGVCLNHRVIEGLRVHAVTADRLEIENRALRRQVRATYGIIHEGLHGGKATDPEHQELCERPACRNARAALAGSREQAATTTTRTITMRCHCGRGVTIGPNPWCEGCTQSAATCDCVSVTGEA